MADITIPSSTRDEFQALLDKSYQSYGDDLEAFIEAACGDLEQAIDRGGMDVQGIMREYAQAAAKLADDYYQRTRSLWAQYGNTTLPPLARYGLVDAERALWSMQHKLINERYIGLRYRDALNGHNQYGITMADLWPAMDNVDDAQQFIADMMRTMARLQTQQDVRVDPTGVRWARVPQGSVTCAFCTMLASRGFAYTSEEAAGGLDNYFHADCDCRIVPTWGEATLDGYDPDALLVDYERGVQYAKSHGAGKNPSTLEVLKAMRRIPGMCTDSRIPEALKKSPGRSTKDFDSDRPFRSILGNSGIQAALKGVNPNFNDGPEWRNNCQRCVATYEMRRRGFSVTALPRPQHADGSFFEDEATQNWAKVFKAKQLDCPHGSGLDDVNQYMERWGQGSRAIIEVSWQNSDWSHVFIAENLKEGIIFFDPQSNKSNVVNYFGKVVKGRTRIMRVDDAEVTEWIKKCCREE